MGFFDRFAEAVSTFVARAPFFISCVLLVLVWAPSLPVFGNLDTWQLVINTITTIVTFLLVALLQNSTARGNAALQTKLNAIAGALADLIESDASSARGRRRQGLLEDAADLRRQVGLEKRMSA